MIRFIGFVVTTVLCIKGCLAFAEEFVEIRKRANANAQCDGSSKY